MKTHQHSLSMTREVGNVLQIVISFEDLKASLFSRASKISYKIPSSTRLCLSSDFFKQNYPALKNELISVENMRHEVTRE